MIFLRTRSRALRRCLAVLLAALCVTASQGAQGQSTTVYSFLRNDVGARAAALAGSVVSVMDDPTALFYNPASLATLTSTRASVGFFKHVLDINAGYLVYGQEITDVGHVAAGVVYMNYGSFDETDDVGNTIGSFTPSDIALSLGYGGAIDTNLYAGGAVKSIYSSIAGYHSAGLAADVGLLYVLPENRITIGASIRNIGGQLSTYAGIREPVPLDFAVGASIVPRGLPLLFNLDFHRLNENPGKFFDRFRVFTVGGEFTLSRVFQLRFGYNNQQRQDLQTGTTAGLAGFAGGIGITAGNYKIDYALSSLGTIGSLHRISLSTSF